MICDVKTNEVGEKKKKLAEHLSGNLSVVTDDCVRNSEYVYIFQYVLCRSTLYRKLKFSPVLFRSFSCIERPVDLILLL